MSVQARISTLKAKHNEISETINAAYVHHMSDEEIKALKKKRLVMKDTIQALRRRAN